VSATIHPTSVVSPDATLGEGVVVGPFCLVEGNARIGARTTLRSHVVIGPHTELGEDNVIFPHATLGMEPQDLKFKGEPTRLVVGSRNHFREGCTLHRGTVGGGGLTTVGDDNFFMTGAHVAHDCQVGDRNIFANCATLAGHVEVGQGCTIGAFSAIHQFCRVGARDTKSYGVNTIGLQRKGFSPEVVEGLKKAFRTLFHSGLLREEALAKVEAELGHLADVAYLIRFIREAKRGIHRG
jgi:UDP-N-acetylglucosamine acyltransferase